MATKKSNIRSMRFSDEIVQLIEAQEGDTFTAKFETLVQRCVRELPQKERELKMIQEHIATERQRLQTIRQRSNELGSNIYRLTSSLQSWNSQVEAAARNLEKMAEEA